jgi:AraC-like DNA-binding protein
MSAEEVPKLTQEQLKELTMEERFARVLLLNPLDKINMTAVVAALCVSKTTFQRKLKECGTSYLKMVSEAQFRRCRELMNDGVLSGAKLSEELGFVTKSGFYVSFRSWSGSCFGDYKKERERAGLPY